VYSNFHVNVIDLEQAKLGINKTPIKKNDLCIIHSDPDSRHRNYCERIQLNKNEFFLFSFFE
jgi:hypothetical protein